MSENNLLLKAENIVKDYYDGSRILHILKGLSIEIGYGESVSIVGSSGSGKSTLLHILGALDKPTSGNIALGEHKFSSLSDSALAKIRNEKIGVIYQFHHLLPEFSALENVMLPALITNKKSRGEIKKESVKILTEIGLADRLTHRPQKLSGGEQQRVALARALINNPDMILADEPTGDLDPETAQSMVELIWDKIVKNNKSLIIVTHDYSIAKKADKCFKIENGKLLKFDI